MKVTIEVTEKENARLRELKWGKEKLADHGVSGCMAIKIARAIKRIEKEGK